VTLPSLRLGHVTIEENAAEENDRRLFQTGGFDRGVKQPPLRRCDIQLVEKIAIQSPRVGGCRCGVHPSLPHR